MASVNQTRNYLIIIVLIATGVMYIFGNKIAKPITMTAGIAKILQMEI